MATDTAAVLPFLAPTTVEGTAEAVPLDAATPLRLDGGRGWWLVQSGMVDLFAVALDRGEPVGRRYPLCRISAGEVIAALPVDTDHTVIAVGHLDTSLVPLARENVAAWPAGKQAELIDHWLEAVAAAVFGNGPAWPEFAGEPGRSIPLPAPKQLFASRGAVWVTPRAGTLRTGDDRFALTGTMPIAAGLSVRAAEDVRVDLGATVQALESGAATAGLERFHGAVLVALRERITQAEQEQQQRLAARSASDRRSLQWALQQLAEVGGGLAPQAERVVSHDPAIGALGAVAAYHGIRLSQIAAGMTAAGSPVQQVARANGLGLRQVLLRGNWWRFDNGPLLATRGAAKQSVALLPIGSRAYRLWDPVDGTSVEVDHAIAAEIAPQAVMAYRPMPRNLSSVAALIKFAGRGVGRELATIIAVATAAGVIAALLPVAMGFLFQSAIPRAEIGQVWLVIIGLTLAAFGAGVFDLTIAIALLRIEGRCEAALQPALMERLLALPVNFFRGFGTGDLANRLMAIQTMRRLLAGNTVSSVLSALFAVSSLVVILVYDPWLALVAAGLVAAATMVSAALYFGELRHERARMLLGGEKESLVVQIIQGITKLRVAASEARIFGVWAALFARQQSHFLVRRRYDNISTVFEDVCPILAVLVLFSAASRLLAPADNAQPVLDLGGFLAVNAAFGQLFAAATELAWWVTNSLEAVPLFERVRPITAAEPEARPDTSQTAPLTGRIEVSHLSFRYTEGSPLVLDDLSLDVRPGAFVAFAGPSGSGKSTLLRLLLGFETAESGDILYDGQPLRTLDAASLRRQIGVVLQHGRISSGSILENITSGLPYSIDDAWAAARLAGLDADIEAMPMGMHTMLMEGSSTLSGGQRQRLMIARALIGKPRLLFFDEATSALDNRTQAVVTHSLEGLRTTRVVVAHRLSTLEHADRIFVLDSGRLVEAGNFDELMARDGLFARLAHRQIL